MDAETENYLRSMELNLENERAKSLQHQRDYNQASVFSGINDQNLIQWQLDLSVELDRIVHLLQGERVVADSQGNEKWDKPRDPSSRVLTDHGVDVVSNIISFLINKNVILSNFSETEISGKMLDFGQELAETIYLSYEKIFYKPPVEDLIERDMQIVLLLENNINKELPTNSGTLYQMLKEKYDSVTITKIRTLQSRTIKDYEEEANSAYEHNKSKYPLLCNLIIQSVHATYNRAWKGGERLSLHTARHVSETINPVSSMGGHLPQVNQQRRASMFKPWTWMGK